MKAQVVFLYIDQGFEARYLLRAGIVSELSKRLNRLVILVPPSDIDAIANEICFGNVDLHTINVSAYKRYWERSRVFRFLRRIRYYVLASRDRIDALDDKNARGDVRIKPAGITGILFNILTIMLRKSKLARLAFSQFENLFVCPAHSELFARYKPDAVITCGIGYYLNETLLSREGKRKSITTISIIHGWDRACSQGYRGIKPDLAICWGFAMRNELVSYQDISGSKIVMCGNAYFDQFKNCSILQNRKSFLHNIGLDPNKKTILFATKSPRTFANHKIALFLAHLVNDGPLSKDWQVIVRLHPISLNQHFLATEFGTYVQNYYQRIQTLYKNIYIHYPQQSDTKLSMDIDRQEVDTIFNQIYHSDVIVTLFSTIVLEALIIKKPVVNIAFDLDDEEANTIFRPIGIDMRQIHLERLIKSDTTLIANNLEELAYYIRYGQEHNAQTTAQLDEYLANETGRLDGSVAKRIADTICDNI
jgi:CDP-glycerol glycerophosphotransferase (TagB/SpsB family)